MTSRYVNEEVYEPREDSFMLKEVVEQYAAGKTLELGCGSGILSIAAAEMSAVDSITAVDININAIKKTQEESARLKPKERQKLKIKKSDMFSNVKDKYDTIIFNPPYLPTEKNAEDIALDGGRHGYEVAIDFLHQVNNHLTQPGIVLLLFSSLTNKEMIDSTIEDNCLSYEILSSKNFGLETLYVYKIEKSTLLRDLEMKGIRNIKKFDRGKRGYIFTGELKGERVAIKSKNPTSEAKESITNEIKVLDFLRNEGFTFIPEVVFTGHNYFVYKFIGTSPLGDFLDSANRDDVLDVLRKMLEISRDLDKDGFTKEEMHRPHKHVFISENHEVKIIDFERARETDIPKNVTQFCQFLTSSDLDKKLSGKGIKLHKDGIRELSKEYKRSYSDSAFDKILSCLQ